MLEQVLFGGLAVGSIYGLVAMGFAVKIGRAHV